VITTREKAINRRDFLGRGTALACALAIGGYAACEVPVVNRRLFPGIRFYPGIGLRAGGKKWVGDATAVEELYDQYAAPRASRYFLTTPRYWFIAEKKLPWREFLVDETLAPVSHEQARDPNWSNYRWNHNDILSSMLQAQAIKDNKAKLNIFVAMTATSEHHPVPRWMTDKGLTWLDTKKARTHVRMDLEEGWRWMADFLVALVRKYGRSRNVANIVIGEYYVSPGPPADLDPHLYRANAKKMWADAINNAPKDVNGNRMSIVQTNPILAGGDVTAADIANLKLGVSGSDPYIFEDSCGERNDDVLCDPGTLHRARQDFYGVVPLTHQCGANLFRSGYQVTWPAISNPFGFAAGQIVTLQLEHVVWYFSSKGVIPLNSMTIKDDPVLTEDWFSTFDRFGSNGTKAAAWGQLPNYPSKWGRPN
jgi:hypothetical protein